MTLNEALAPVKTSRPRIFVPGATPATIPETFVPCPLSSSCPSSGAKSWA
jgi:hypothetical protein